MRMGLSVISYPPGTPLWPFGRFIRYRYSEGYSCSYRETARGYGSGNRQGTGIECRQVTDETVRRERWKVKLTGRLTVNLELMKVWKTRLEVEVLHLGSFIIPKTIKYYSFLVDNIPKIRYTIEGREV